MPCYSSQDEDEVEDDFKIAARLFKKFYKEFQLQSAKLEKKNKDRQDLDDAIKLELQRKIVKEDALVNLGAKEIRNLKVENSKLESLLCESFQLLIDNNIDISPMTNLYEFYLKHKQKDEEKIFVPVLCSKCHIELNQYYSIINTENYHGYLCSECYADN